MTREELLAWRKERGLSWVKAAALIGVHPRTWARWERGERPLPAWLPQAMKGTRAKKIPAA